MTSLCEYEELRKKNIEDNKQILDKLMSDLKGSLPRKIETPRKKQKRHSAVDIGPVRRNPSRNARYSSSIYSKPVTRTRRGSMSSTASSSSSSTTTPSSSPNKLLVRFGFFHKAGRTEETDDNSSTPSDDDEDGDLSLPKRVHRVNHDARSADEITEDDVNMVASFVSDKKYDSFYGSTCHQCRQKTNDMKTICRSGHCFGVRGQFCGPCLRNRYGEDAKAALKNQAWVCPPCRGVCNCSFCRKKNGKSCTGILIHLARGNGYQDVNSYLQSFKK